MKKLRPFVVLTLVLAFSTTSIYAQTACNQENESYSCAYNQSSHTAHWSVYVPIAILVGAAIWFGISDCKHEHHSSNSQDGLGSIVNSKRHPNHSSDSHKYSLRKTGCRSFSSGSFSHQ